MLVRLPSARPPNLKEIYHMSPEKNAAANEESRENKLDVVVVGAGFAGLYLLYRLRKMGLQVRVLEAGSDIGGTWHWNRYPGARCDIESMEYSYQFSEELQQEWNWSERYATQPEILDYVHHVADKFDLRSGIQLNTRVVSATFDEQDSQWTVTTENGERFVAPFCVMATGCLSSVNWPDIPGRETFKGLALHTGQWPTEPVDFTGMTVGVIGTGSSGIQSIPMIAKQAKHLYAFQRSPTYSVPAHNRPLDAATREEVKAHYAELRTRAKKNRVGIDYEVGTESVLDATPEEREAIFDECWAKGGLPFLAGFADLFDSKEANDFAADYVRRKIHALVKDPETADALSPETIIGCKRLCVDTDYYVTFNRDNVSLVDLRKTPIKEITATGIVTDSDTYDLDAIVYATGFDALTGALNKIDITGKGGLSLRDKWESGARSYLGLGVAGFPNLFTVNGPGSPSVLSNVLQSIEQHVEWITDCIAYMSDHNLHEVVPTEEAEAEWSAHVNSLADASVYPQCNSWYLGANIPGKPRVFLAYIGFPEYTEKVEALTADGYKGFEFG